jgi:hypothetical protein
MSRGDDQEGIVICRVHCIIHHPSFVFVRSSTSRPLIYHSAHKPWWCQRKYLTGDKCIMTFKKLLIQAICCIILRITPKKKIAPKIHFKQLQIYHFAILRLFRLLVPIVCIACQVGKKFRYHVPGVFKLFLYSFHILCQRPCNIRKCNWSNIWWLCHNWY